MEVTINGARIHYQRSGKGFPLLLIHAGIADSRMWEPQAKAFANEFDMIRPDMGCSMGGTVALDLTLENPDRVAKLVLVGSGVSGSNLGEADSALFADVEAADKAGDIDAVNRAEVRLWVDGPRRPEGSAPAAVRELVLDMNGRSLQSDWASAAHQSLEPPAIERLEAITAPTLVIVGDEDLPHAAANAEVITSRIPDSRSVIITGAAHLPSLEHPEEFNRVVLDFLLAQ
jgi:pimeloyl-ACP methyl ester carboxylesterase